MAGWSHAAVVESTQVTPASQFGRVDREPARRAGVGTVRRPAAGALGRAYQHAHGSERSTAGTTVARTGFDPSPAGSPKLHDQ